METPKKLPKKVYQIGILAYPNSQASAISGLEDLFSVANKLCMQRGHGQAELNVQVIHLGRQALQAVYDAIILPPSLERITGDFIQPVTVWIRDCHQKNTLICSVCAGAFLLAETGLLDYRVATTHWALAEEFRECYPKVDLNTDKLITEDGHIVMAGGLMAWADLGLKVVERYMGVSAMLQTAQYFLIDPVGREQRFYSSFTPPVSHGDKSILAAQEWLVEHLGEIVTVPMMAEVAKLEGRTFIRRFKKATRLPPSEYLQHLRIDQAKKHLELTRLNVEAIAWECGYENVSAFRKVFMKLVGLTPREYRKRFQV